MSLLQQWEQFCAVYPDRTSRRVGESLMGGVSSRLSPKRMRRLLLSFEARTAVSYAAGLNSEALKALRVMAALNQEQARDAFRLTMVANITAPLVILAVINQTFPGWFGRFHTYDPEAALAALIGGGLAAVCLLGLLIFIAVTRNNHARDLRHLLDYAAAERGIYFGAQDADETLPEPELTQ